MIPAELFDRAPATDTLRSVLEHGGFALVTGEPGIGKSSLVGAVATQAEGLVLTGACWEEAGVPERWPWVQVVRALRGAATPAEWAEAAPALEALLGERDPAAFPLADALTGLLGAVAARRPVLLVLEDLHWADAASLALLEFVVRHRPRGPLAIVGTYRDGEWDDPGHKLAALAATAVRLPLSGLDEQAVGELIERVTGLTPEPELVARIHLRTAGNPFFVEQTARLWQGGSPLETLDPGSTALLRRRLSRLPAEVAELLGTIAVLGPGAHRELLAALHPAAPVQRLLAQALGARLIRLDGPRVAFQHELLRDTVRGELPDPAGRHAAVVRAAADPALAALLLPAELAHHAHLGAAGLPAEEVLRHQLRAAEDAEARFAHEEAARHLRHALPQAAEPERTRIRLRLGEAAHRAGDQAGARAAFEAAMDTARALDEPELLARTALTLFWLNRHEQADPDHLAFIAAAHARLLPGAPASPDRDSADLSGRALSRHAAGLARRLGDDEALRFALFHQLGFLWSMDTAQDRLELTAELLELAHRARDHQLTFEATAWRAGAQLELGDPAHLATHRQVLAMAARFDLPTHRHEAAVINCLLATLRGDFAAAREHAGQARAAGDQPHFSAQDLWTLHRAAIAVRAGDWEELTEALAGRDLSFCPLLEALAATRSGDLATADRVLAEQGTPSRWHTALWWRVRVETALLAGDPARIAEIHAELRPHADRWAITGTVVLEGPVRGWLARLDAAAGRLTEAAAGFRAVIAAADALGARPWAEEYRAALTELASAEAPASTFRRESTGWRLSFGGRTTHHPPAKGLQDLHHLLSAPDREASAVSLLSGKPALGADPVLDETAKAAYRARLTALEEELAAAFDDARAERLERERQALLDELRAATGLLGRSRRLGDEAERARKAVTNRIRDTLRRLDGEHPELAAHLRESVFTGSVCRYRPVEPVNWRL